MSEFLRPGVEESPHIQSEQKKMRPGDVEYLALLEKNYQEGVRQRIARLEGAEKIFAEKEQRLKEDILESNDPLYDVEDNPELFNLWCRHNAYLDQCEECRSEVRFQVQAVKQEYDDTLKKYEENWVDGGSEFQDDTSASLFSYHDAVIRIREEYIQKLLSIRKNVIDAATPLEKK